MVFLSLGYHPDQAGGAYRYVTEVAECLAGRGDEVFVIYPGESACAENETRQGVQLRRFPNARGSFAANWLAENRDAATRVREIAVGGRVLLIVCHAFFARAAQQAGLDYVAFFTGPWAEEFLFSQAGRPQGLAKRLFKGWIARTMRRVERDHLGKSQLILTISDYYMRELPHWHPRVRTPTRMIGGGVNLDRFRPPANRQAARARLGVAESDFLLLAVRRLDPRMGLRALIDAFANARLPVGVRLWIAGKGPEQADLEVLIQSRALQQQVRLLGFVPEDDLPELYGAADCSIVPSLALEGFGLVLVESLACGTPALGSRNGAIPEILEPLSPSLLIDPASVESLAASLHNLASAPSTLPSRDLCRAYVEQRYPWTGPANGFRKAAQEMAASDAE